MKVCVVSLSLASYFDPDPRAAYSGAEVQAAFLAGALAASGVEVSLVVANLRDGLTLPFPAHNAFHRDVGLPGLRFFHPRLSGILGALEAADADVYHQHCAGMITGVTAMFCRRRHRVFVYGAGSDTDFSWRSVRMHGLRDRALYWAGLRLAHGVVAQNSGQETAARRTLRCPVRTIATGVPRAHAANQVGDGPVLWMGGLRAVKRPELFIELARRTPAARFCLVGGPIGTEPGFARGVTGSATGVPNLELTGWLPHPETLRLLRGAALLVNTSRVEGFPNAYLEAWSHGVPVVSFNDVDGLIAGEGLGVVCDDIDGMARAVGALLGEPERRRAMGARARALVESRFSEGVLGPRYVAFFEELIRARSR
ncbi:MAG: glycosyltransferase family 4 protein [Candidatus Krumholzibacteria bacterium]|nr:glycosyltransferase family 4 protein [Candidatus Krumholzibacteria bacterium]